MYIMDNICQNNKILQQELDLLYTSLGVSFKSVRRRGRKIRSFEVIKLSF